MDDYSLLPVGVNTLECRVLSSGSARRGNMRRTDFTAMRGLLLTVSLRFADAGAASSSTSASLCKGPQDAPGVYVVTCFSPAERRKAETMVSFTPPSPDRADGSVGYLRSHQVAVYRAHMGGRSSGEYPDDISYMFGKVGQTCVEVGLKLFRGLRGV
jgi:hypothetical protein